MKPGQWRTGKQARTHNKRIRRQRKAKRQRERADAQVGVWFPPASAFDDVDQLALDALRDVFEEPSE